MAVIANPLDEKDKNAQLQGTEGEGIKQISSAGGTLQAGGTPAGAVDTTVGTPQSGAAATGGQDVSQQQKYLDVNKEKALQLAGQTAGIVTGDINKAKTELGAAGETYKQAVGAGTVNLNQDVYGRATGALVDQTAPGWSQEQLDKFMADQAAQDTFKNQYNATYGGPQSIESQDYYAQAARDAAAAQRTMGLIGDTTGRQELIARTYQNPSGRFSKGALSLDESLLSGNQEAYNQLLAAQDTGLGLKDQQTALGTMSKEEYDKAMATTAATKQTMQNQFNLGNEEGEVKTQTQAIQDKAKTDYENYLKYINSTYGTQEGVQASQYFTKPQDYINIQAQNVMSAGDVARMKALESLTGGIGTLTPFANQAGQYTQYTDPSKNFNTKDFQTKVDTARTNRLAMEADNAARIKAVQDAQNAAAAEAQKAKDKQNAILVGAGTGAAIGSVVPGVGTAVGAVVGGAIGAIACFAPDTEVLLESGKTAKIKDIKVGDVLRSGGKVYSVSSHFNKYPTFKYNERVMVTGEHAVLEDGEFIRVKDSNKAIISYALLEIVHTLSCENHRMIIEGITFSDYDEVDSPFGKTDPECLIELNRK